MWRVLRLPFRLLADSPKKLAEAAVILRELLAELGDARIVVGQFFLNAKRCSILGLWPRGTCPFS